ncbi:universal stress protein [Ureibacillus thermophilus]|uniref:Universal stress protein n=1 Tax=Ureibacillus thermophilus TaxID=367743 RepID=A0A4P6UWJ3_9BACL|nr:universal stress protein [Ureibacillus thermophilus]QBK26418.1 universal stress protein [Ureibacillus thermophilus]
MGMYKKIAVAIDFSEGSKKAFQKAVELAKMNQAALSIVHVVDTKTFGSIAAYDLKYAAELREKAEDELAKMKEEAEKAGVANVEILVKEGAAKSVLTNLETDLIVCGATGLNRLEKLVVGSVAERIVRNSKYDVFIVR